MQGAAALCALRWLLSPAARPFLDYRDARGDSLARQHHARAVRHRHVQGQVQDSASNHTLSNARVCREGLESFYAHRRVGQLPDRRRAPRARTTLRVFFSGFAEQESNR